MKCLFAVALVVVLATSASALRPSDALNCATPCTASQCKNAKCVAADPYACVAGSATGGCATSASWFSNTSSCTACCDVSGCDISCPACSAAECRAAPCTSADPFVCTMGADAKGCATTAGAWKLNPGCSKCCDLSNCPTLAPTSPPTAAPQVKLNCKKSCGDKCKNAKTCSNTSPYMCTAGNATWGCLKTDAWFEPSCTDCCDVSMCPQTPCGACSPSVCKNTQCNYLNPFICTAGTLSGGCSASKTYWPQSPDCTSCCDLAKC